VFRDRHAGASAASAALSQGRNVLRPRLVSIVVAGSSADGNLVVGYSDVDCMLALDAPRELACA